ncbi:aminotransferase class V-fold PLP-dependent enzyme [Clostridium felsineum]|uniref:aminotransferase class V-fold PLP-dependent enzyme n=1 Tax=Clostridium felsineum TaxID=36839 RepID=UPI00214D8D22|nr:aminotransferase class V-fold PLP-dependent enzyme [Clostridium felsineum]MCR3758488.1 aminotransferase class V-fold PLP-dependent enzyme [Clostridium felsineum]
MDKEIEISKLINKYFSLSYDEDLISFKNSIEEILHNYKKESKITSNSSLGKCKKNFLDYKIPYDPKSLDSYVVFLKKYILPDIVNVSKPTYLGHMTSAIPNFFQYLAQFITQLNLNVVKIETSKAVTLLERQSIAMLHKLFFNYSDDFYERYIQDNKTNMGAIVSGGTQANITALWIARNNSMKSCESFQGIQKEGVCKALNHFGYTEAVIIGSRLMHYSIEKASSLLGIGVNNLIKIGLNDKGTIDVKELKKKIIECKEEGKVIVSIIGIAGTTETGKIDDLYSMAQIAKKYNIHFHVDASWGGPIVFSDKYKHMLKGIELADTVTVCGHKQLFLPQGISVVLCRDFKIMNSIKFVTRYQARNKSLDLGKYSPEGSRAANSLFLHAALTLIGKSGYEYLINEGIKKAAFLADLIMKSDDFELIEEPQTNIVNYRYIPKKFRKKLKDETLCFEDNCVINSINEVLQEKEFYQGETFISRSSMRENKYGDMDIIILRAVVCNPLSTEKDIYKLLENQKQIGEYISDKEYSYFIYNSLV